MLVRDNPEEHRYELVVDDQIAGFILYEQRDDHFWLVHTEIEEAYQGAGVGSVLVRETLDHLRSRGALVVPTCPFVRGWIRRHPKYRDIVDEEVLREFKRSCQALKGRVAPSAPDVG